MTIYYKRALAYNVDMTLQIQDIDDQKFETYEKAKKAWKNDNENICFEEDKYILKYIDDIITKVFVSYCHKNLDIFYHRSFFYDADLLMMTKDYKNSPLFEECEDEETEGQYEEEISSEQIVGIHANKI